jgi:hypothetical protein
VKHSVDELIEIAYRNYPRGIASDDPRYTTSVEWARLVAERKRAGSTYWLWRAFLRRLGDRFPECEVQDRSLHLPAGGCDAAYSAALGLPSERYHAVAFLVGFIVPYFVVYSTRLVDAAETTGAPRSSPRAGVDVYSGDTMFVLPAEIVTAEHRAREENPARSPSTRRDVSLALSPEEQPYASWLGGEIQAASGYEPMPPEVGRVIVPDVALVCRSFGEATIHDCLFSDNW